MYNDVVYVRWHRAIELALAVDVEIGRCGGTFAEGRGTCWDCGEEAGGGGGGGEFRGMTGVGGCEGATGEGVEAGAELADEEGDAGEGGLRFHEVGMVGGKISMCGTEEILCYAPRHMHHCRRGRCAEQIISTMSHVKPVSHN